MKAWIIALAAGLLLALPALPALAINASDVAPCRPGMPQQLRTLKGLFTVHVVCDHVLYEIPLNMLDRDMLLNTEFAALSAGTEKLAPGAVVENRVVRWTRRGNKVYLEAVQLRDARREHVQPPARRRGRLAAPGDQGVRSDRRRRERRAGDRRHRAVRDRRAGGLRPGVQDLLPDDRDGSQAVLHRDRQGVPAQRRDALLPDLDGRPQGARPVLRARPFPHSGQPGLRVPHQHAAAAGKAHDRPLLRPARRLLRRELRRLRHTRSTARSSAASSPATDWRRSTPSRPSPSRSSRSSSTSATRCRKSGGPGSRRASKHGRRPSSRPASRARSWCAMRRLERRIPTGTRRTCATR